MRLRSSHFAYLCVLGAASCSARDPGVEGLMRYDFANPPLGDGGVRPDTGTMMGMDGSVPGQDAGVDVSGPPTAFTGAPGFTSQKPAMSARAFHAAKMVSLVPGKATACLTCHRMGGSAPAFLFGGSVFTDLGGNTPAIDYEVRVRAMDGTGYIAHSDDDGNFWFKTGPFMFPAHTGARNAAQTALMSGTISSGDCNSSSCHAGGQGPIHVP